MAKVGTLNTYAPKTTAVSADVNENFADLKAAINAIDAEQFSTALAEVLGVSVPGGVVRCGKSVTAAEHTRGAASYGPLSGTSGVDATDEVRDIELSTDGLLVVACQALWKSSLVQSGKAALFLNGTQVKMRLASGPGVVAPGAPFARTQGDADEYEGLASGPSGLHCLTAIGGGASQTSDVTTGQIVGISGAVVYGGPVYIFAAAGTYDVAVQYLAEAGTVSAKERHLWVWTKGF
jgi:hypothetical protein